MPSSDASAATAALAAELAAADPVSVMTRALATDGPEIAIAFSGAEDVLLLELARLSGQPFRVFCIDTGRLHAETYRFLERASDHFRVRFEYLFPDAAAVEALTRSKGQFSFYRDGHSECCGIRKVAPLRRHLSGLSAWITGQRRDQSPTRSAVPVVQIDAAFAGRGGQQLRKWNPLANTTLAEVWAMIRAYELPTNELHDRGFTSIGCEPCTRALRPGEHERAARWWWEESTRKECGLHPR